MAEFVEYRIEKMLPELEQMERVKLFTSEEIRAIAKKRKIFEHKIERMTKCKEDYTRYISFEVALLKDISLRRDKFGIKQKKDAIEYAIAKRVNQLYKQAVYRFQDDVRLWLAYIKFCKGAGFTESVSQILGRLLSVHGDKERLWHMAAKWELEEANSIKSARQFLLRGLHFHPSSHLLYKEMFRLALSEGQDTQDMKQAEVIYSSALKNVNDIEFLTTLLKISEEYEVAKPLQERMVTDLMEQFPLDELMWHTMAQRELQGKHFNKEEETNTRKRLALCVEVYEAAVKKLHTEGMWCLYLDAMLEVNREMLTPAMFKRNALSDALRAAHDAGFMTEKYYLLWLELLEESSNVDVIKIMEAATDKLPHSSELWQVRMRYHIKHNEESKMDEVFEAAIVHLDNPVQDALPLWKMLLLYYQTKANVLKVQNIYVEAMRQPGPISNPLKPRFIEWVALIKGISAARKAYHAIAMNPPICLPLHQKMAHIESVQVKSSPKHQRKCHTLATEQFGKENTDIWIEYIKFEMLHGDPLQVSNIYNRAIATLDNNLTDTFEAEFNQIKTGMDTTLVQKTDNVDT